MEIYVGNLPWSMTEQDVQQLVAAHGTVERAKLVMDRETGRSRGFAFITMPSNEEGQAAIAALNGTDQGGRSITVRVSEPRPSGGGEGGGGRGFGGGGGDRGNRGGGGGGGGGDRGGYSRDRR